MTGPDLDNPLHDDVPENHDSRGQVKRRTIVLGAAWSIPVIALTVGTPLAAASVAACGDQTSQLSTSGLLWNDGANGANNIGLVNGENLYGPITPLFADLSLTNVGTTTVSGLQANISLEMPVHDSTDQIPTMELLLNGVTYPFTARYPRADQNSEGLRWVWSFDFVGVVIPPGQQFILRSHWRTTQVTNTPATRSRPFSAVIPTQTLCNEATFILTPEQRGGAIGAQTSNAYWVQT